MIGVDTNILIWGLDCTCTPGMENQVELAKEFFRHVADKKITLVIPAQSLAEFLVRNTETERDEALAKLEESFPIAPLDFSAAGIAAQISSERDHCKEVRATFGVTRNCYKADVNVLASVINYGAARLVTGNYKEIRALAKGRIIVESLEEYVVNHVRPKPEPEVASAKQAELFSEDTPAVYCSGGVSVGTLPQPKSESNSAFDDADRFWFLLHRPKPHPMRLREHLDCCFNSFVGR